MTFAQVGNDTKPFPAAAVWGRITETKVGCDVRPCGRDGTASAASDGLHIKFLGVIDISVPQSAIQPILHCWEFTLTWGAQNPALFVSMLVFLLLALGLVVRGSIEKAARKQDYERTLEQTKIPELPLPPPDVKG